MAGQVNRTEAIANPEPELYCRNCGYNLRGLSENRCPECNRSFDPKTAAATRTAAPSAPRLWSFRLAWLASMGWGAYQVYIEVFRAFYGGHVVHLGFTLTMVPAWIVCLLLADPVWHSTTHHWHARRLLAYLAMMTLSVYLMEYGNLRTMVDWYDQW